MLDFLDGTNDIAFNILHFCYTDSHSYLFSSQVDIDQLDTSSLKLFHNSTLVRKRNKYLAFQHVISRNDVWMETVDGRTNLSFHIRPRHYVQID